MEKTQMMSTDPNKTIMGTAPTIQATMTIKPVQCPVCKSFNPIGVMFCVECGLIFDRAIDGDAFGAPTIKLNRLVDESGREHVLRPGENTIGRTGDIAIEDGRVSRLHASVTVRDGKYTLQDLGSTNGTKVNGTALPASEQRELSVGDRISFGGFEVQLSGDAVSQKTGAFVSTKTAAISAPTVEKPVAFVVWGSERSPLKMGINTFGRKSGNDVAIVDPYVSSKHGEIEVTEDSISIRDLGSTNGTSVNGNKLQPDQTVVLAEDDQIKLGEVEIRIVREQA
jgi:pSer/pThr/pTyr-binding forkhead associated (FHA) protein